jgi:hypothetical protein
MLKNIFVIVLFTLISHSLAQLINSSTLAVSEFEATGVSEDEAKIITGRLRAELINTGAFRIMERSQMKEIMKEQGFQSSGLCNTSECTVEMGEILGVEQLVVGQIGKIGTMFTISARIISVETGEILRGSSKDQMGGIELLLSQTVPQLAVSLSGKLSSIETKTNVLSKINTVDKPLSIPLNTQEEDIVEKHGKSPYVAGTWAILTTFIGGGSLYTGHYLNALLTGAVSTTGLLMINAENDEYDEYDEFGNYEGTTNTSAESSIVGITLFYGGMFYGWWTSNTEVHEYNKSLVDSHLGKQGLIDNFYLIPIYQMDSNAKGIQMGFNF